MSAVYKGQYGTVLSERFQKALLSSGDREALENMKKGEEVSVKSRRRDHVKSGSEFVGACVNFMAVPVESCVKL